MRIRDSHQQLAWIGFFLQIYQKLNADAQEYKNNHDDFPVSSQINISIGKEEVFTENLPRGEST